VGGEGFGWGVGGAVGGDRGFSFPVFVLFWGGGGDGGGIRLTTHLQLEPSLRMSVAVTLSPYFMAWTETTLPFLDAIAKSRKAPISFVKSFCPTAPISELPL